MLRPWPLCSLFPPPRGASGSPAGAWPAVAGALLAAGVLLAGGCASSSAPAAGTSSTTDDAPTRVEPDLSEAVPAGAPSVDDANSAYARRHFVRGLTHSRLGAHDEALVHFEKALQTAPQTPAVLSALAEALAARGDLSTAVYQAEQARRLAPERRYYHRQVARLYRQAGQPREALAAYEPLLDSTRARRSLLAEVLPLYREVGDARGVERTLAALAQKAPPGERDTHRRALARFYSEQGRPQAALPLLEAVLRHTPADAEAATLLAEAYRQTGRAQDAAALDGRVAAPAASQENSPAQLVAQARARRRGNAPEEAEALAQRALRQDSTHAAALALLGDMRFERGAFAAAARLLVRSLDADPRAPGRWAQAAAALLKAGHPERAAATADEGLLLFPGQVPLLRVHAAALAQTGRDAEAARHLEEALRVLESDEQLEREAAQAARLHDMLARLRDRQGKPAQAARHRRQARALRDGLGTASN